MSVGTVSPKLLEAFNAANAGTVTRTLVAKIDVESENISNVADGRASVSIQRDYQQLQTFAEMYGPCWFLVKHQGKGAWRIYTYCPDSENVKTKMLYSTAKETLLRALGVENFDTDIHASTKEELLYANVEKANQPAGDSALSKWELEHKAVLKAEADEAKDRGISKSGDGIGGYHTVNIPLAPSAKDLLGDFKVGSSSFIELKISDDRNSVEGVSKGSVAGFGNISSKLNPKEPRFYFLTVSGSSYLLYLCPDSSPISIRMVYSTAKPAVAEAAKSCGIRLARVVEASDAADVDANLFQRPTSSPMRSSQPASQRTPEPEWIQKRNQMRHSGGAAGSNQQGNGGGTKNAALITTAHPTAQLLGGQVNSPSGPKKKIVMPPQGAW